MPVVIFSVLIVTGTCPWRWVGQDRAGLGLDTNQRGVVTDVRAGSQASSEGIRAGDVIPWTSAKVGSVLEGDFYLTAADLGKTFEIGVRHGGVTRIVNLPVERQDPDEPLRLLSYGSFVMFITFMILATIVLIDQPSATAFWLYVYAVLTPPTGAVLAGLSWLPDGVFAFAWTNVEALSNLWGTVAILPFVVAFPDDSRIARRPGLYRFAVALALGALAVSFMIAIGAVRGDVIGRTALGKNAGEIIALFATLPAMLVLIAVYVRSHGATRQRLSWALFGTSFAAAASLVSYFDVSDVVGTGALVTTIVMPITLAYAILRHHVIDIRIAFNRSVAVTLSTGALFIVIGVAHWAAGRIVEEQRFAEIFAIIVAIGLGFAVDRLHQYIEHFVDGVLFRERFDAQEYLGRSAEALAFAREEDIVRDAVIGKPVEKMRLSAAVLYRRDAADGNYRIVARAGSAATPDVLDAGDEIIRFLRAKPVPTKVRAASESRIGDFAMAFPISVRNDVEAFAAYGVHSDGSALDGTEIRLLERLAQGAAAAADHIENVRLRERLDRAEQRAAEVDRFFAYGEL